jgi:hypothetical protein
VKKKKKELEEDQCLWHPQTSYLVEKQVYESLQVSKSVAWELKEEEDRLHLLTCCFTAARFETLQKVFCVQLYLCIVEGMTGI